MNYTQHIDQAIDIAHWRRDEEFAEYPEGARDKTLVYNGSPSPHVFLKDSCRYLFKRSSSRYPEQFWVEIFAYLLGIKLGLEVPPAFVAYDSKKNQSGALIEWFLNPITLLGDESYIPGGDYCQRYIPNFDRKKGKQHNFETVTKIFEDLNQKYVNCKLDWKTYWAKTFTFDALLGNTDRHQDNWGIIVTPIHSEDLSQEMIRISPVFDNGTSMGHEIFPVKFKHYDDTAYLKRYVLKGWHHMKWNLDHPSTGHINMLKKITERHPETKQIMLECLKRVSSEAFQSIIDYLLAFDVPVKLSAARGAFMLKLLQFRHQYLLNELE